MKRAFDFFFAVLGLVLLSPVLVGIALAVKYFEMGPAFFAQERIGRDGKPFRMFKFRSMITGAPARGPLITVRGDARITPIGRILRATKLDELPQLWNVVRGEMSLVGPRPEVETYVRLYSHEQREVLKLTPGITDPASFAFYDESELLGEAEDPHLYYQMYLMPEKIRLNLEYAAKRTLWTDFVLCAATIGKALGIHVDIFKWLGIRPPELGK
jgi:lipopolysaccharide/colanic/teichoic acid biosynthesis glycosyltransferase